MQRGHSRSAENGQLYKYRGVEYDGIKSSRLEYNLQYRTRLRRSGMRRVTKSQDQVAIGCNNESSHGRTWEFYLMDVCEKQNPSLSFGYGTEWVECRLEFKVEVQSPLGNLSIYGSRCDGSRQLATATSSFFSFWVYWFHFLFSKYHFADVHSLLEGDSSAARRIRAEFNLHA